MSEQSESTPIGFNEYHTLLTPIMRRLFERKSADAALFRLLAAHAAFQVAQHEQALCSCAGSQEIFNNHQKIRKQGPNRLDIEYSRDSLIITITLLDSFVTDVTRFLLLLRPQALPKDRQVKVIDVVRAKDHASLVTSIVEKYVQELAYKSIDDRIIELAERFGIETASVNNDLKSLQPLIDTRHTLIHTVSGFRHLSTQSGTVTVTKIEGPVVTWDTAEQTQELVLRIVKTLSREISLKLFGREPEIDLPDWRAGT
jgi:hypothetical protein